MSPTTFQTIDWQTDYDNVITIETLMAWRVGWFTQKNNGKLLTYSSDLTSYQNQQVKVGLLSVLASGDDPGRLEDSAPGLTPEITNEAFTVSLKIDVAYKDEVNNDQWFYGRTSRKLYKWSSVPSADGTTGPLGLGTTNFRQRYIIYFTRCCRADYIEDVSNGNLARNGMTVWIDRRRRYSLQTRAFPRQYVEYLRELPDFSIPAVNRDDVFDANGALVFMSRSGYSTMQTGYGDSGLEFKFSQSKTLSSTNPTPYRPRGKGTILDADALNVFTNGTVTWYPQVKTTQETQCITLSTGGNGFCAYVGSFTIEDRGLEANVNLDTTPSNRIGVMNDFLFIVQRACDLLGKIECPPVITGATTIEIIPTVPRTIRYRATSNIDARTVTIQYGPPPEGISLTKIVSKSQTSTAPAYIDITFDVAIDGAQGGLICLQATSDTPLLSLGIFCPKFVVRKVDYTFMTGTMRGFDSTTIKANAALPTSTLTLSTDLDSKTRLPVSSGTDKALFDNWWTSSTSTSLYTLTLTRWYNSGYDPYAKDSKGVLLNTPRVYTALRPFWSNPAPNQYQTFEFHGTMDLLDTETLRFGVTGGELFVFINGKLVVDLRNIAGITPLNPENLALDNGKLEPAPRIEDYLSRTGTWTKSFGWSEIHGTIGVPYNASITAAPSYNVDIFYTQRSSSTQGFFLEMANSTACNPISILRSTQYQAIADAAVIFNFQSKVGTKASTWQPSYLRLTHQASYYNDTGLVLITGNELSTSAAVWTSEKLKVLSGLEAKFSFTMKPNTNTSGATGLAFVIQPNSNTARGADGQGLGYSGLSNAIVVEFDCKQDTGAIDPAYNHLSVHKPFNNVTTSVESSDSWPLGTAAVGNIPGLPFNWANVTRHDITVLLTPTSSNWWLYVYVNANVRPLYTASFAKADLSAWFANGAYVGITTTNTNTQNSTVVLSAFSAVVIPPLAKFSGPTSSLPIATTAGNLLSTTVQLCDACRTPLQVEGESGRFFGKFVHKWAASPLASQAGLTSPVDILDAVITDVGQGRYTFSALALRTGEYKLFLYFREVNQQVGQGQPLGREPLTASETLYSNSKYYTGTITPALPSATISSYIFGDLAERLDNTNNSTFFNQIDVANGVACYPSTRDAYLLNSVNPAEPIQAGRVFTSSSTYSDWVTSLQSIRNADYIHCVNKAPYSTELQAIFDMVRPDAIKATAPESTPLHFPSTPAISAVWVLARKDINQAYTTEQFDWSYTNALYKKYALANGSGSVILQSAPPQWTNNVANGIGMILLHPLQLIRPSATTSEYYVYLRDLYGNAVTTTNVALTHSSIPELPMLGVIPTPLNPSEPFWNLPFTTGTPGTVLLSLYDQDGVAIGEAGQLVVSPGRAHYSTSTASGVTITGSVDNPMAFSVKLMDISNYHITTQVANIEITAIEWVSTESPYTIVDRWVHGGTAKPSDYPLGSNLVDLRQFFSSTTRQYEFTYTPRFAGTFNVKIYINSECSDTWTSGNNDCAVNPAYELTNTRNQVLAITPGPSASTSTIVQSGPGVQPTPLSTPVTYKAGDSYTFYIESRDQYGNERYSYDQNAVFQLQLWTSITGGTQFTGTQLYAALDIPSIPSNSFIPFPSSSGGSYTLTVVFKHATTVNIIVELIRSDGLTDLNGIITTGSASKGSAKVSTTVIPGDLAPESIYMLGSGWDSNNNKFTTAASQPSTKAIALQNEGNNIFFAVKPLDKYSNQIIPTRDVIDHLSVQYVTDGLVYYSDFKFSFLGIDTAQNLVVNGFPLAVTGTYTISITIASSTVPLTPSTAQLPYNHKNFVVFADIPHMATIATNDVWPDLSTSSVTYTTFVDYDRFSNQRVTPSPAIGFEIYSALAGGTCTSALSTTSQQCLIDGDRPEYKCPLDPKNGGKYDYYILPSTRSSSCSTITQACADSSCYIQQTLNAEQNTHTDAYVAGVRYFNSEPSSLTTTTNGSFKSFVTLSSSSPYTPTPVYALNQDSTSTSADRWMLIYVVDPTITEPYVDNESRQLTLEADTSSIFTQATASTPIRCSNQSNGNSSILSLCSTFGTTARRLYIFKVRLNTVPPTGKSNDFFIRYGFRSSINTPTPYSVNVVPGILSAATSQWLDSSTIEIDAGNDFSFTFKPYDQSGNKIPSTQFTTSITTPAIKFALYLYTPTLSSNPKSVDMSCMPSGENYQCTTLITVIGGKSQQFQNQKLEAIYLYASTVTAPSTITSGQLTNFISRSIRTVRINPGPIHLPSSVFSMVPTGSSSFEPKDAVVVQSSATFYLSAYDIYGNSVVISTAKPTPLATIGMMYNGSVLSITTWSSVSKNVFSTTTTMPTASRNGLTIVAYDTLNSSTTDNTNVLAVRTKNPLEITGTTLSSSIDSSQHPSLVYDIVSPTDLAAAANYQTVSTFSKLTIDSVKLSYVCRVVDIDGRDYIYNLATKTLLNPNDNTVITADLSITNPGTLPDTSDDIVTFIPATITQLLTSGSVQKAIDGKFVISLPLFSAAGVYTLQIYASGKTVYRNQINVGAGNPKLDYTTFGARSTTMVTGSPGFFTFTLYDRLYNPIKTKFINDFSSTSPVVQPTATNIGDVVVVPSIQYGAVGCNPDIHDFTPYSRENLFYALPRVKDTRFTFDDLTFDSTSGQYKMTFTPSPTGIYTFNLTAVQKKADNTFFVPTDEQVFSCNYLAPLSFNVETGAPHSTKSYFTVTPGPKSSMPTEYNGGMSGYAGQTYIVDVYFLDRDGNQSKGTTNVKLFYTNDGNDISMETDLVFDVNDKNIIIDPTTLEIDPLSYDKTNILSYQALDLTPYTGIGHYRFTFRPRVANRPDSTFNFKLSMQDPNNAVDLAKWNTLKGVNPLYPTVEMPTTFQVLHGIPASIAVSKIPSTIIAGDAFSFQVVAMDVYGNQVTTNALSSLSIRVTRVGSSMVNPIVVLDGLQWYLQPSSIVTTADGVSTVSFDTSWEGHYSIDVIMTSKNGATHYATLTIPDLSGATGSLYPSKLTIVHATCAGQYLATHPKADIATIPSFMCQSTGICVREASQCTNPRDQIQCLLGQFVNENGVCESLPLAPTPQQDPNYVPVATDYQKCLDGTYISATQTCPPIASCPTGTVKCPNSSDCRSSTALCPTTPVCPAGLMVCPNGISCATTLGYCPTIPQSVVDACEGKILCPSGVCVNSAGECPTPPTCPTGQVYCLTDGSCRTSSSLCPSIPIDQVPTPVQCQAEFGANGVLCGDARTCAAQWDNCPSSITCPIGSALCAIDNSCQTTTCPTTPAGTPTTNPLLPHENSPLCALTEFRCSNGGCVQNLALCGSKQTCPTDQPILCSDLNCKSSLALCNQPITCLSRGLLQCVATGACVDDLAYCSTPKTCSDNKPVLCSSGDCSSSIDTCTVPLECPPVLPYLCSSGNCRASVNDCPTLIGCPSTSPFRCDDNSCVLSTDLCKSTSELVDPITGAITRDDAVAQCPPNLIKCPTGECSAAVLTCPTHVTCPVGTSRCPNGQCRAECSVDGDDLPTCASTGLITCPISSSGYACSSSIAACPQGITCPLFQPVKCAYDSTCVISVDDCPRAPAGEQPAAKTPCFDGSWISGLPSDCPTAVTCTPNMPIKCSDSTCRETIEECPVPQPCPSDSSPYRCTNGQCVGAPWDCGPVLDGGIICSTANPIKCPAYQGTTKCVADITKCDVYRNPDGTNPGTSGPGSTTVDPYTSPCSPGFTYCRDGSCQESPSSCPLKVCSVGFPVLCDDGSCAQSKDKCTNMATGCPYNIPNRCPGSGKCVKHIMECPANPCAAPTQPCIDGTCKETCTLAANGCAVSQFRCNDGTCVSEMAACSSRSNIQSANSCPPAMPHRCGNGFCVEKESQCVTLSATGSKNCPVLCADGLCRDSTELCPLIKPCTSDKVRCGDGSCRVEADCPSYNSCPTGQTRCKQTDYLAFKIQDGLCAEPGKCYSLNGCPLDNGVQQHRCTQNGRCVKDSTQCLVNLPTASGCNSGTPYKCWDSSCVASAAECPQTNGCPTADKPNRCPNGDCIASGTECSTVQLATCPATKVICADGSCVDKISQCKTSFNCPVDKPFRCYNGDCKQYSSKYRSPIYGLTNEQINAWTCPPVVSCPSTAYTMCANFKCVLSPSLCPSTSYTCDSDEFMCTDGTCRPDTKWCGYDPKLDDNGVQLIDPSTQKPIWTPSTTKPAKCPITLPVMCSLSGQCVSDITSCNNNADPSTTLLTGSSSSPTKDVNQEFQVQCFDGTWVNSYAQCRIMGTKINDEINSSSSGSNLVPKCIDYCPNGECIVQGQNAKLMCGIIPACSIGQSRCFDGSCRTSCDESIARVDCMSQLGDQYDPLVHVPNVDGVCRSREESVGYLGCSVEPSERFHCANRECASDKDNCPVVAVITSEDSDAKIKLGDSPYAIKVRLELEAERLRKAQRSYNIPMKPVSLSAIPNSIIASFQTLDDSTTTTAVQTNRSCTTNCVASRAVYPTSILYSPLLSTQTYNIAPLATGTTVQLYSGLDVNVDEDMDFNIHPVGANMYFNATNKLTYSRIPNFDGVEGFTAAQTVLSPVFSCSVGEGIVEPFSIGVKFSSLIDRSQTPTPQPDDICLARLRRFPQHNYQVWMCEFDEKQRTSGDLQYSTRQSTEQPLRQAISFISQCSDPDFSIDNSINETTNSGEYTLSYDEAVTMGLLQTTTPSTTAQKVPAVYAFIHSPLSSSQVYLPSKNNFWKNNIIWLLFVIIGGIFVIFALSYAILRLSRYSSKTDKIKDEIENTEKEVLEMEQFGGDKRRDGEVAYQNNPLAVSLQQQNQMEEMNESAMAKKQAKLQEQQALQTERHQMIEHLEADNEAALAHLEHLRKKASTPATSP